MKRLLILAGALLMAATAVAQASYTPIQVESKVKPHNKWVSRDTRIVKNLHGYTPDRTPRPTNRYGSDLSKRYDSTGFFHVVRDGHRWWIVDPDGYRNFNLAVVGVRKGSGQINKAAFAEKYNDDPAVWAKQTGEMLHSLSFNGTGAWSSIDFTRTYNSTHEEQLCYTQMLNWMSGYGKKRGGTYSRPGNTGYPNQCIFVFDAGFEAYCNELAAKLLKFRNDRNLLGYFSDNEMPVDNRNLEGYLDLPEHEEGRKYAEKWLKEKGVKREEITDELRNEFAGVVAERYYSIVAAAIRKYDPNHMYLGSRLHGRAKNTQTVVEAAGRHCDIVSINYYGHWTPSKKFLEAWDKWANKPFIVTEFYTKGMDAVGLANTSGAGWCVRTQKDRGYAYQHFTLGLLEAGNCVGWHWFRYQDNDPTAKADKSNIDSNKGLVDNHFECYTDLAEAMKEVNANVYSLAAYFDAQRPTENKQ